MKLHNFCTTSGKQAAHQVDGYTVTPIRGVLATRTKKREPVSRYWFPAWPADWALVEVESCRPRDLIDGSQSVGGDVSGQQQRDSHRCNQTCQTWTASQGASARPVVIVIQANLPRDDSTARSRLKSGQFGVWFAPHDSSMLWMPAPKPPLSRKGKKKVHFHPIEWRPMAPSSLEKCPPPWSDVSKPDRFAAGERETDTHQ
jgi:hypothetical protein